MAQVSPDPVRYRALDGYRFLAASGVALSHYDLVFDLRLGAVSATVPQLGEFVDFFFILSGFVIGATYAGRLSSGADYRRFLQARLARIWPLHLATAFASLALVPLAMFFHVAVNHPEMTKLSALPANLAMVHAWGFFDHLTFNGPSWSISAEWFVYLLCPVLLLLAQRLSTFGGVALGALFIAAMILVRNRLGLGDWTGASCDFGSVRAVPLFFAGLVIAVALARRPAMRGPSWLVVHALFIASLLTLHLSAPREIAVALFALVVAGAALAERAGRPTRMGGRLMSRLGDASYAIYLTHFLIAVPVVFMLRKANLLGTPAAFVAAGATLGVTILLSLAIFRWFESPLRRRFAPKKAQIDGSSADAKAVNEGALARA